jgi:hypothetical protein
VRRLAVLFPGTTFTLLAHYGNSGAIHFHIQNGDAGYDGNRQVQLHGPLALLLLTLFDICSDGFGRAFYRLSSDRQTGQKLQLFSASIEGSFMADRSHHPAYPR